MLFLNSALVVLTLVNGITGFVPLSINSYEAGRKALSFHERYSSIVGRQRFETRIAILKDSELHSDSTNSNLEDSRNLLRRRLQQKKSAWIDRSINYYCTIMREEERIEKGEILKPSLRDLKHHQYNLILAKKLYFARNKIKSGKLKSAELIYRNTINELMNEGEACRHADLAVSTLLLALLLQREGKLSETRDVFLRFFRIVNSAQLEAEENGRSHECTCSAKVIQAFALFEMKQGYPKKALRLIQSAIKMDKKLVATLKWKQFREAGDILGQQEQQTDAKAITKFPTDTQTNIQTLCY